MTQIIKQYPIDCNIQYSKKQSSDNKAFCRNELSLSTFDVFEKISTAITTFMTYSQEKVTPGEKKEACLYLIKYITTGRRIKIEPMNLIF